MARIYQPLKRESTGRWDMTVSSDDEGWVHAVGYCAGWRGDPDEAEKERMTRQFGPDFCQRLQADWDAMRPHRDKFHTDGHATSQEASACYDQYQLHHEVKQWKGDSAQHKCAICEAWTPNVTELGSYQIFYLCDAHSGAEFVQQARDAERAKRHR